MNVFYLDTDPKRAAQAHGDKHCVKMILECAQLLSTAHHILDGDDAPEGIYKCTHKNHPSGVWVRESVHNYLYVYELFIALCDEYTARYGKTHLTDTKLRGTLSQVPTATPTAEFTHPPQCMPEEYHNADTVAAYRAYYMGAKRDIVVYAHSETPEWFV